jgi:hypothetical protein
MLILFRDDGLSCPGKRSEAEKPPRRRTPKHAILEFKDFTYAFPKFPVSIFPPNRYAANAEWQNHLSG